MFLLKLFTEIIDELKFLYHFAKIIILIVEMKDLQIVKFLNYYNLLMFEILKTDFKF
jgi:hypothetical protein